MYQWKISPGCGCVRPTKSAERTNNCFNIEKDQQRTKQHTGSESRSLYKDGHKNRNNIQNEYKDNIQTQITRIHYCNKRRHIYEECENAILYGILCCFM
jgi:hypothetical protein